MMMIPRLLQSALAATLLLLAWAGAAQAEDIRFTGQVTYRERLPLPADAELRVSLVTTPGNIVVAAATARIVGPGQVPLDFVLDVRSTLVDDDRACGLVAELRAHGRTLFRTAQPVAVDPKAPAPVQILVHVAPEPAPREPPAKPPAEPVNPLLGTAWTVIGIDGDPVLDETEVTLSFAADQRAGGHGGCNNYFTEARFGDHPLSFGPVAGTRRACPLAVAAQESALFDSLGAVVDFELSGPSLVLQDAAGVPRLELNRLP